MVMLFMENIKNKVLLRKTSNGSAEVVCDWVKNGSFIFRVELKAIIHAIYRKNEEIECFSRYFDII